MQPRCPRLALPLAALVGVTVSCSRTLLLPDAGELPSTVDASAPDAPVEGDAGSDLDQTVGADDGDASFEPDQTVAGDDGDAADSSGPDSAFDASADASGIPDVSSDSNPPADAAVDVDARADAESDASGAGDAAACGAVGQPCCDPNFTCASGLSCDGTTLICRCLYTMCGTDCSDTSWDVNHCGSCANACFPSEQCVGGHCECGSGQTLCFDRCVNTGSDPNNCSGCGISCQTVTGDPAAECVWSGCRTKTVILSGRPFVGLALDDTNIYYSTDTTVEFVAKAGGSPTVIAANRSAPKWLLVDGTNIYWSEYASVSGGVYFCPITGCTGAPSTLATSSEVVQFMAMNATTVFWTTRYAGVLSCAKAGCGNAPLAIAPNQSAAYLALDSQNVYWSDGWSGIFSCPLTGCSGAPQTLVSNAATPLGLVVDSTTLYWAADYADAVFACSLSNCQSTKVQLGTTVQTGPGELIGDSTNLYFTMTNASYLGRMRMSGGSETGMAWTLGAVGEIVVDSTSLYWTESMNGLGGLYKTDK